MTGQLCLKWNNHTSAFNKLLDKIYLEDMYSDGTILCQGKFYPVHRFVLSTCSEYFEEMFRQCIRLNNKHPFIIVKDIHPDQMEALLNYMYKGEVNVPQEMLPELIKAAEAFKIKGLAVPDEEPSYKHSRKRSSACSPSSLQKKIRRQDEKQPNESDIRLDSQSQNISNESKNEADISSIPTNSKPESKLEEIFISEPTIPHIKSEPIDLQEPVALIENSDIGNPSLKLESNLQNFDSYTRGEDSNFETYVDFDPSNENFDDGQSTSWDNSQTFEGEEGNEDNPAQGIGSLALTPDMKTCPMPGCTFASSDFWFIKRHFRSHSGEKPFQCSKCSFRSSQKNNIDYHEKTVHSKEKPFSCQFCPLKTAHKSYLKSHTLIKHADKIMEYNANKLPN